jgi:hypothetical protein
MLGNYNARSQRYSLVYAEISVVTLAKDGLFDKFVQQHRRIVELVHLRRPTRIGLIVHLEPPLPTTNLTRLSARKIDNSSAVRWDFDINHQAVPYDLPGTRSSSIRCDVRNSTSGYRTSWPRPNSEYLPPRLFNDETSHLRVQEMGYRPEREMVERGHLPRIDPAVG